MSEPPQTDLFGEPLDPLAGVASLADDPERWPRQFAEMTDIAIGACGELPPRQARLLAMRVVVAFAREYGGSQVYWPKSDAIERAVRDLTLWAEHDGTTEGAHGIRALARRYRLTDQRVWAILQAERRRHQRRFQLELPLPEPRAGEV